MPAAAAASSSSPFSHSPFTTDHPDRSMSLSPSSVPAPITTYPDPMFDPWARSGAAPDSSMAPPYPPLGDNNPYSPTNPYSVYSASAMLPPPSPSTDSHPSTGVSGVATGQEQFKLQRMTGASGSRVEEENDEQVGVEEHERGRDAFGVIREREGKEVRVNLPVAMLGGLANDEKAGVDDDDDDDSGEEGDMDITAAQPEDGKRRAPKEHRRQRSNKTKSKLSTSTDGLGSLEVVGGAATTTGVNPHIGFTTNAVPTAAASRSGAAPGNAERHAAGGFGFGQRMKNPNAQPYYAYAAMANAHGYGGSGGKGVYLFFFFFC